MSSECDKCGEHALECTCPTVLTDEDIKRFVEKLKTEEIKKHKCFNCVKEYYFSYGNHIGECDECWFSRFPKEQIEDFCRSFFE